jgi:hypothetical protein
MSHYEYYTHWATKEEVEAIRTRLAVLLSPKVIWCAFFYKGRWSGLLYTAENVPQNVPLNLPLAQQELDMALNEILPRNPDALCDKDRKVMGESPLSSEAVGVLHSLESCGWEELTDEKIAEAGLSQRKQQHV